MTTGHFALAALSKRYTPTTPLWVLLIASWLLDVVMATLMAAGIESAKPLYVNKTVYGGMLVHGYVSHSLLGVLILAAISMMLGRKAWNPSAGKAIGLLVVCHWVLDFVVHFQDLSILPFNVGNFPMLGLGLWKYPLISMSIECLMTGFAIYTYHLSSRTRIQRKKPLNTLASSTTIALAITLIAMLLVDFFGSSLELVSVSIPLVILIPGVLDSRLNQKLKAQ